MPRVRTGVASRVRKILHDESEGGITGTSCVVGKGADDGKEEGEGGRGERGRERGRGGDRGGKNEDLQGSSNPDVKEIYADAYLPLATFSADMRETQYRFQVGELEEATAQGCGFTISQMNKRLVSAAEKAQSSAEELRDRQCKYDVQERGYLDDARAGKKRKSKQDVADLEFVERRRESLKWGQAQIRELVVQARVNELKQAKVGKKEWWQTVQEREEALELEREQARLGRLKEREEARDLEREQARLGTRQLKKAEREEAKPGVASIPRVETRQMKKARSS
jgi:hypothetical protein